MAPKVRKQHGVKGEVETRQEISATPEQVVTTPAASFQAGESDSTGQLPMTGLNAILQIALGGFSLAGGGLLFRRSSAG